MILDIKEKSSKPQSFDNLYTKFPLLITDLGFSIKCNRNEITTLSTKDLHKEYAIQSFENNENVEIVDVFHQILELFSFLKEILK